MILRFLVCLGALGLDALLGEPRRGHPLVVFGRTAEALERRWNRAGSRMGRGLVAVLVLVVPPVGLAVLAAWYLPAAVLLGLELLGLYLALGLASLAEHGRAVARPLADGDLAEARRQTARMVSRDVAALEAAGLATATTESVLENGADAVTASLFWYLLAGLPGVVLHRLINTLDAMWGYRTERFLKFGRAAARLDDFLGWLPARLTALGYAASGRTRRALACWRRQAPAWPSPNAGPVMAAGGGALGLRLGGPAPYDGGWRERPTLGEGALPGADAPLRAIRLLRRSVGLWLVVIGTGVVTWHWFTAVA